MGSFQVPCPVLAAWFFGAGSAGGPRRPVLEVIHRYFATELIVSKSNVALGARICLLVLGSGTIPSKLTFLPVGSLRKSCSETLLGLRFFLYDSCYWIPEVSRSGFLCRCFKCGEKYRILYTYDRFSFGFGPIGCAPTNSSLFQVCIRFQV